MQKLLIDGKKILSGNINISGSKNSSLPILAATILNHHTIIKNIPYVNDILTMLNLLKFIGLKYKFNKKKNIVELCWWVGHKQYLCELWAQVIDHLLTSHLLF